MDWVLGKVVNWIYYRTSYDNVIDLDFVDEAVIFT